MYIDVISCIDVISYTSVISYPFFLVHLWNVMHPCHLVHWCHLMHWCHLILIHSCTPLEYNALTPSCTLMSSHALMSSFALMSPHIHPFLCTHGRSCTDIIFHTEGIVCTYCHVHSYHLIHWTCTLTLSRALHHLVSCIGLAKTVFVRRLWPYIWWFSSQKHRMYTVYIWFWPTLVKCYIFFSAYTHVTSCTQRFLFDIVANHRNSTDLVSYVIFFHSYTHVTSCTQRFLFDIVANHRNSIDVDKVLILL